MFRPPGVDLNQTSDPSCGREPTDATLAYLAHKPQWTVLT